MRLSFKSCLDKGLLRKIPASEDNALRSINKAGSWLEPLKKTIQAVQAAQTAQASSLPHCLPSDLPANLILKNRFSLELIFYYIKCLQ
jgi:hypothetical protein